MSERVSKAFDPLSIVESWRNVPGSMSNHLLKNAPPGRPSDLLTPAQRFRAHLATLPPDEQAKRVMERAARLAQKQLKSQHRCS